MSITYFWKKYSAVILLSVVIGILCSAPAVYFRYFDGGYRGIDFFGSDGEFHYLGLIQEIYDGHWSSGNIYLAENKADPYVQQPLPAIMVALLGKTLGMSSSDVNIFTKFLFPAILTVIVYLLFLEWTGRRGVSILMAAFVMMVQATWIFLNPGAWLPFFKEGRFIGVDHNFISYTRTLHPQLSSIFFFGYLLFIWKFLFAEISDKSEKIYGILSAFFFGLSFYIYFFAFSFLLALNAVFAAWFLYSRNWRQFKKLAVISVGGLAIAAPYFINVLEMQASESYAQLTTRLGMAESNKFIFSRVWWGVTALFLALYRGPWNVRIFILGFLAAGFLVTNQQVITGKTASLPAHYHWYYIAPVSGAVLLHLFFLYFEKFANRFFSLLTMLIVFMVFLYAGVLYQKVSFAGQRDYFMDSQKYAPALSWLNKNVNKESVIFTDDDLSLFIPVYTSHNVYHSDYLVDSLVSEERLKHSLYARIFLSGVTHDSARQYFYDHRNSVGAKIFSHTYQKNGCYGCFPDSILESFISEYQNFLNQDFATSLKKYRINYMVWNKDKNPKWRLDRFFNEKVYDQDNIVIYSVS